MDFALSNYRVDRRKLLNYGFKECVGGYVLYIELMNGEFTLRCFFDGNKLATKLLESDGEEYVLFNVSDGVGEFVGELRAAAEEKIKDIKEKCFEFVDVKEKVLAYVLDRYGTVPEYPWADEAAYADACTLKNGRGKWYGIIMTVPCEKLGLKSGGNLDVLNVKNSPSKVQELIDGKNVFAAYHMNKTHWLSVVLDANIPFEKVSELIDESFALAGAIKSRGRKND